MKDSFKVKLQYWQLCAVYDFLRVILAESSHRLPENHYYRMQLLILGDLLRKKIHPHTLADTGKPVQMKWTQVQNLAFQLAFFQGWVSWVAVPHRDGIGMVIRYLIDNVLPVVVVRGAGELMAPGYGEE